MKIISKNYWQNIKFFLNKFQ